MNSNKDAHLTCYVWFVDGSKIVKNVLFCKSITTGTKAQDLFKKLDTFMVETGQCVLTSVPMVVALSGHYGGLQALI